MEQKNDMAIQSTLWQSNSVLREKRNNPGKQSYMPFLFRSKRQFIQNKQQSPPVGSYQISSIFDQNKGNQEYGNIQKFFHKQNQMGVFKSKNQRFNMNKHQVPGPASYNFIQSLNKKIPSKSPPKQLSYKNIIKKSPSCPTIPDNKVKYGYVKDNKGEYQLIQKSNQQIQKQKQNLKEYCSNLLVQQNNYQKRKYDLHTNYKKEVITNLSKFLDKRSCSKNQQQNLKANHPKQTKPKIKLSHGINIPKNDNQNPLGPGCYNVSLDTIKKAPKKQEFQFFGSSQIRFSSNQQSQLQNPYQNLFKEKKNLLVNQKAPGKIYKKSFNNIVDKDIYLKNELPGPGYYDPSVNKLKKSHGNVKFGSQSRFKQNYMDLDMQQIPQQNHQQQNKMQWGHLRKDKIKSPQKQFQPVRPQQIYGIMNQVPSDNSLLSSTKYKAKQSNQKPSAVFLDKSSRFDLTSKTQNQETGQIQRKEIPVGYIKDTKGGFISKLSKNSLQFIQKTPGPGAYQGNKIGKKTFNIKKL